MTRSSLNTGVSTLKKWKEKGALRFDLAYQRHTGMWSLPQKSMLVWSMLADSYIPPVVFIKNPDDVVDEKGKSMSCYSVLDGLQRLSNLFSFMNDEYRLHGSTPDVEVDGEVYELAGLLFSELEQELQNHINAYKFSIQAISDATEDEETMLFTNINSGCALSTIQKAKPELGIELCNYFSRVLETPFFSQALNMTAAQALREEDLAMALQSLMLISDYEDYKSLSVAECLKFATYLKEDFSSQEQDDFFETVDYLSVFDKKAKYLRKNNVAVVVALADQMKVLGVEASEYKAFLNDFFASDNEDYKNFSGSGNVKRPNVEARYAILREECYKYFDLELPPEQDSEENSELDYDEASGDGNSDSEVGSAYGGGENYGG